MNMRDRCKASTGQTGVKNELKQVDQTGTLWNLGLGLEAHEAFAVILMSAPAPLGSAAFFKLSPSETRVHPHPRNGRGEPLFPVNCARKLLPNMIRDKSQQSPLPGEVHRASIPDAHLPSPPSTLPGK